ncbi:unnamed protein product [Tenebrio molitor]|nr:unnamed protein product [Tenebrio molitor]
MADLVVRFCRGQMGTKRKYCFDVLENCGSKNICTVIE